MKKITTNYYKFKSREQRENTVKYNVTSSELMFNEHFDFITKNP